MRVHDYTIEDMKTVSPTALSAYARSMGWAKAEQYGSHSDVYAAKGLPDLLLPRTQNLADYPSIVMRLMSEFSEMSNTTRDSIYRDLVTADRDVMRLSVHDSNGDGSLSVDAGVNLMEGARDIVLAAACSLNNPRAAYRMRANQEATDYLRQVRLGQTERGSYVVSVLSPVISPPVQQILFEEMDADANSEPLGRQVTKHMQSALVAVREAIEQINSGVSDALNGTLERGVSANFCEAIATALGTFAAVESRFTWALTRPTDVTLSKIRFVAVDGPILREAARSLRSRAPRQDVQVFGFVQSLQRDEHEMEGTIVVRASIDGKNQSVGTVLSQSDYERAIDAHKEKAPIVMSGDLERGARRWQLLNPRIVDVIKNDDDAAD